MHLSNRVVALSRRVFVRRRCGGTSELESLSEQRRKPSFISQLLLRAICCMLSRCAGVLGGIAVTSAPEAVLARFTPKAAPAGTKVVVIGGNGFVGR